MRENGCCISYKSILKITLPLVFVSLSCYLMMSIDRIILSTVNTDMMNSVAMSMLFINIFIFFFTAIIDKNSIFTSQYYGDKQNEKVATCVWQMIFLSLLLIPLSLGMAFVADKLHILPDIILKYGIPYQRILFAFSFLFFIYEALTTFFIAQGKTYVLSISIVIGCIVNVIFSIVFIKIFNLGTSGSAYGTVLGLFAEILFLGSLFLNKSNNDIFKTRTISYDLSLLKTIFKIGFPTGFVTSLEQMCWIAVQYTIHGISNEQLTLYNLVITAYLFFGFISNAITQSTLSIGANLVAQNNLAGIKTLIKRFLVIIFTFLCFAGILIVVFKGTIMEIIFNLAPKTRDCSDLVEFCVYFLILTQPGEFLFKMMQGICLSGGDTKFVSIINAFTFFGLNLIPILILKHMGLLISIRPILYVFILAPMIPFCLFYYRYKSLKWYKKII